MHNGSHKPGKLSESVEVFDKLADLYKTKYWDVSHYSRCLEKFLQLIPANGTVLDIACGPGNYVRYLLERRKDLRITGIDMSPNMIRIASHENPDAHFEIADGRNIRDQYPGPYDAVICAFLFPYLNKEEAVLCIRDVHHILKQGGTFYLSVIEDLYHLSGPRTGSTGDQIYMHYHEKKYLSEAIQNIGSEILYSENLKSPSQEQLTESDLILISVKS